MSAQWQDRVVWFCLPVFVVLGLGAVMPNTVVQMMTYDSVADMAANANPASYVFRSAYTRGYYAPGDGGGGHFYPIASVTSTNFGSRIKALQGGGTFSWDLVDKSRMNVKQFGCKGDNANADRLRFVDAVGAVPSGGELFVPAGTYLIDAAMGFTKSDFKIVGAGLNVTILKYSGSSFLASLFAVTGNRWELRGCQIDGNAKIDWLTIFTGNDWVVEANWLKNAFADDNIDPGQGTICTDLHVSKGSTGWSVLRNKITDVNITVAGSRSAAAINLNDGTHTSSADDIRGTIRGNLFDTILHNNANGDGNGVQLNLASGYNSGVRIEDNDFRAWGRSAVKIIGDGAIVTGNNFDNTLDTGSRTAAQVYGSNNQVTDNVITGAFVNYGIEVGTTAFEVSGNVINGNTIKFTGTPAGGFPIGVFFSDNTFNSEAVGNIVVNASYHTEAFGNVSNCRFDNLLATNIVSDVIKFVTSGSASPSACSVGRVQGMNVGGLGVNWVNGTNIDLGTIKIYDASAVAKLPAIAFPAGFGGTLLARQYLDGVWFDWNGLPMNGSGWIWDECLNGTFLLNNSSTLNTGTASLSGSAFDQNHSGAYSVGTASATNAAGTIRNGGTAILFGSRTVRACFVVKTPAALSGAADKYELFTGFGDATTAANTDGAFFDYTHDLNSGNWTGKTCSGGSFTTASGGSNAAVTANAYWWLGVEGNSTNCKFYVALDSSGAPGTWTLIGTSAANLPSAGTTGFIHEIIKQAGSTGTTTETYVIEKVGYQP